MDESVHCNGGPSGPLHPRRRLDDEEPSNDKPEGPLPDHGDEADSVFGDELIVFLFGFLNKKSCEIEFWVLLW